jgi:serine/threonine protein kinase
MAPTCVASVSRAVLQTLFCVVSSMHLRPHVDVCVDVCVCACARTRQVLESADAVLLVSELVDGQSLSAAIKDARRVRTKPLLSQDGLNPASAGVVPEVAARLVFFDLVSAVVFMHSRGVIHGDVRPGGSGGNDCF